MKANIIKAIDNGKWENGLKNVSLEDWKKAAKEKGVGRIAAGVEGASAKVESFYGKLFPYQESLQNKVNGMPDLSLQDNINRMVTFVTGMSKFQK